MNSSSKFELLNMNKNLNYYNQNAEDFVENTFSVDMKPLYDVFLKYVKPKGYILDVGCGSGRDALYFSNHGYIVDAFDYSNELVKKAREKTGLPIRVHSFYEISDIDKYDGIWACASLLHCERNKILMVMQSLVNALKSEGIGYVSFKYGDQDRVDEHGREFIDFDESSIAQLFESLSNIVILKQWITNDNRIANNNIWINILFQKQESICE